MKALIEKKNRLLKQISILNKKIKLVDKQLGKELNTSKDSTFFNEKIIFREVYNVPMASNYTPVHTTLTNTSTQIIYFDNLLIVPIVNYDNMFLTSDTLDNFDNFAYKDIVRKYLSSNNNNNIIIIGGFKDQHVTVGGTSIFNFSDSGKTYFDSIEESIEYIKSRDNYTDYGFKFLEKYSFKQYMKYSINLIKKGIKSNIKKDFSAMSQRFDFGYESFQDLNHFV